VLAMKLHWGILIFLAVAGPWYTAVSLADAKYRDELLIVTNFERFFSSSFAHTRPFWYYFKVTPGQFLPWTLFLPSAVLALRTPEGEEDRKPLLFTMIWVAALFVFFSISKTKRSEYLLPIFPAMALLVGYVIDRGLAKGAHSGTWWRLYHWPMRLAIGLLFLGGIGTGVAAAVVDAGAWLGPVLPIAILATVGAGVAGLLYGKGRGVAAVVAIVVVFAGGVAWGSVAVIDRMNPEKSTRNFSEAIADRFPEGSRVYLYNWRSRAIPYYIGRRAKHTKRPEKLALWFDTPERLFIVFKEEDYDRVKGGLPVATYVLHREWVDHRWALLVSTEPD
jgi:4-amino-4-deoxy-L-arabinose transferase-like glycosyltransferase